MSLAAGTRLGPYEVLGLIGAGGMGEVYKAKDTRLDRTVAIKLLPAGISADPDRRARFEREARAIAGVVHPHICTLHDFSEHAGSMFLVMEHLDGETLAERLKKGPLPIDQVLTIATDIADALAVAHRHGIIHRDLKPANLMLTKAGTKLLDFGLAKLTDYGKQAGVAHMVSAPTRSVSLTAEGEIVGTLQYMAPEQLEGWETDARADIFAFGAVVYEMATGRKAFEGKSKASLIAAILEHDPPPISTIQPLTSPLLDHLVKTCIAKDRDERWQSAGDMARNLRWITANPSVGDSHGISIHDVRRSRLMCLLSVALVGLVAGALATRLTWRASESPKWSGGGTRTLVSLSPAEQFSGSDRISGEGRPNRTAVAVAPDGRSIVFSGWSGNQLQLYLRPLDDLEAKPLAGTEGGIGPFFSPDGQWIGYWTRRELRKIPLSGGPSVIVCQLESSPHGASWGTDDQIVLGQEGAGLWQVPAKGGMPRPLTTLDKSQGEVSHRLPHVLPDGNAVLFTATRNRFPKWSETRVFLYSRRTGTSTLLIDGGADARYVASGHLVYAREGVLLAVPFNIAEGRVTGSSVGLIPSLMQSAYHPGSGGDSGAAQFSVSLAGTLAYVPGSVMADTERSLAWIDRAGRVEELPIPAGPFNQPRLSPDGRRVAVGTVQKNQDVWVLDLTRKTSTRLTKEARNGTPVWTPDGDIVYRSSTTGPDNLYWRSSDRIGSPERLTITDRNEIPASVSPNGETLAYYVLGGRRIDVWTLPLRGKQQPTPLIQTAFMTTGLEFSPDGRWLSYASNESGRFEVYVQPYGTSGSRHQVSANGGLSPVWRHDGRELFFLQLAAQVTPEMQTGEVSVMAVPTATFPELHVGVAKQLFAGEFVFNYPARSYDVTADGQHFVMLRQKARPPVPVRHIVVIQNWLEELRAKVPTK
jgi:serine/threonine protein kinase